MLEVCVESVCLLASLGPIGITPRPYICAWLASELATSYWEDAHKLLRMRILTQSASGINEHHVATC